MTPRDPLPEPWRTALERKGITTKRGLATAVGISPQTAKRLIDGIGEPSPDTVAAVAEYVFGGDFDLVYKMAGLARRDHGDIEWPAEARQLNPEQREAIFAVIRAMVPRTGTGRSDDEVLAQIREAARSERSTADVIQAQKRFEQQKASRKGNPQLRDDGDTP